MSSSKVSIGPNTIKRSNSRRPITGDCALGTCCRSSRARLIYWPIATHEASERCNEAYNVLPAILPLTRFVFCCVY